MRDLELKVIEWATDRNLYEESTPETRLGKLEEELQEFKDALFFDTLENIKLEAGDVLVTLENIIHPLGLDFYMCLSAAYEKIKNRTGKMENGTFVKDTPAVDESEIKKAWLGEKKPEKFVKEAGWQGEEKAGNINLKFVGPAIIETPEKMAELHWNYIKSLLVAHGFADDYSLNLIGFHYRTSFVHGFKHGVESI
jgi:NTP pyrophosphatase (non-canonical NTP hydrolase)